MANEKKQDMRFQFLAGATDLLGIAKRTAELVATVNSLSSKELRDSNLVTIVFSALAVEAFLNELATIDPWSSEINDFLVAQEERVQSLQRVLRLAEDSNLQAPAKLKLAHEILGQPLDAGSQLFQDYRLLKQLRDSIVHAKPTGVLMTNEPKGFRADRDKLLHALHSRGLLSYDPAQRARGLLDWLDSPTLGQWAMKAASGIVINLIEILPDGRFKEATALFYHEFSQNVPSSA